MGSFQTRRKNKNSQIQGRFLWKLPEPWKPHHQISKQQKKKRPFGSVIRVARNVMMPSKCCGSAIASNQREKNGSFLCCFCLVNVDEAWQASNLEASSPIVHFTWTIQSNVVSVSSNACVVVICRWKKYKNINISQLKKANRISHTKWTHFKCYDRSTHFEGDIIPTYITSIIRWV